MKEIPHHLFAAAGVRAALPVDPAYTGASAAT
jgi:hypothetical protein